MRQALIPGKGIAEIKINQILEWWNYLKQRPDELEVLKGCQDLFQVSQTFGFKMLRNRLLGAEKNYDIQITTLCVILGHVEVDDEQADIMAQFSKALSICSSEVKDGILEIPQIVDRKDLLRPFVYAIAALEGKVNVLHLIETLYYWDENLRENFRQSFLNKT